MNKQFVKETFNGKLVKKTLATVLASAVVAGSALSVYAATSFNIQSKGDIKYDDPDIDGIEVWFHSDDLNNLATAINAAETKVDTMESALKTATGKSSLSDAVISVTDSTEILKTATGTANLPAAATSVKDITDRLKAAAGGNTLGEAADNITNTLQTATGKTSLADALSTLESVGLASSSFMYAGSPSASGSSQVSLISGKEVSGASIVDSTEDNAQVAQITVPAGVYDGNQTISLDLLENNNYYYKVGKKDIIINVSDIKTESYPDFSIVYKEPSFANGSNSTTITVPIKTLKNGTTDAMLKFIEFTGSVGFNAGTGAYGMKANSTFTIRDEKGNTYVDAYPDLNTKYKFFTDEAIINDADYLYIDFYGHVEGHFFYGGVCFTDFTAMYLVL